MKPTGRMPAGSESSWSATARAVNGDAPTDNIKGNDVTKNILMLATLMSALLIAGCATDRGERRAAVRGALIGAAGGAAVAAVTGGDALDGAAIGAAGGAAIGAITHDGKRRDVYRDGRGRKYWTDDNGRRHRVR